MAIIFINDCHVFLEFIPVFSFHNGCDMIRYMQFHLIPIDSRISQVLIGQFQQIACKTSHFISQSTYQKLPHASLIGNSAPKTLFLSENSL